jgi:hypothetical protein
MGPVWENCLVTKPGKSYQHNSGKTLGEPELEPLHPTDVKTHLEKWNGHLSYELVTSYSRELHEL